MNRMEELLRHTREELDRRGHGARKALAETLGISPVTLSAWLAVPPRQKPGGEHALALADWLRVTPPE